MIAGWQWWLKRLTRRLWFKASLFSLLGMATALISAGLGPFIPSGMPATIGSDAVDGILHILASSLLAVTTFSLSTAVQAYSGATAHVTPRATTLLVQDSTTHNALATFIGGFLYSLVGIIALSTGLYGAQGRVVLFIVTLLVVTLIVVALLRWVDHLMGLVRVPDNTRRVEDAALEAVRDRLAHPYLGGRRLEDSCEKSPEWTAQIRATALGYVQNVDVRALAQCADAYRVEILVAALPGTFVDTSRPLAFTTRDADAALARTVVAAFAIDRERSFDQDPRFGLAVLSEIASRALSPSVNDPGTAIDVIGRSVRVLAEWQDCEGGAPQDAAYPTVHVRPVRSSDLFDDAFAAISRDGSRFCEVVSCLLRGLLTLAKVNKSYARLAAHHAEVVVERTEAAALLPAERAQVLELVADIKKCVS